MEAIYGLDYRCLCCYDLLLDPVSLLCGHNICKLCLAKAFLQSSTRSCPICTKEWIGYPQVNMTLRYFKIFEKLNLP